MTLSPVVVFVIEPDVRVRDVIGELVREAGFDVRFFDAAAPFLAACDQQTRGCVLIDLGLPAEEVTAIQSGLRRGPCRLPVIVLCEDVGSAPCRAALEAGAVDVVNKPVNSRTLLERIHEALDRDQEQRDTEAEVAETRSRLDALNARERDVLDRLVAGESLQTVAAALDLSPKTIESYRTTLVSKLAAEDIHDLLRRVAAAT